MFVPHVRPPMGEGSGAPEGLGPTEVAGVVTGEC